MIGILRPFRAGTRFRSKLIAMTALAVAFALLLSIFGLIGLQYFTERNLAGSRHDQIARVISANIGPALLFGDRIAAEENLRSVHGISDIGSVSLYSKDGALFAEYTASSSPEEVAARWPSVVSFPVLVDDERLGELRMRVDHRGLLEILAATLPAALAIFLVSLAVTLVTSRWLNTMAFRPIDRLSVAMRRISDLGDYAVRLERDPDPDFDGIVSSFNGMIDEVESRNAELSHTAEQLRVARDEAEHANVAKSQFLANMSHELRTPLNAIIGYTEVLQEELVIADMPRSVEDVQWIYGSARQLLALINGILDLSKIEAGRMDVEVHEFDVRQLVREVGGMLEPIAAQKGNTLHLQVDSSVPTARSDSAKLRQCLLNLGSNACKFTENGHVFVLARHEGDDLVFTVSDTGIGMSEEELSRLFQPFMQADASTTRRYGGTGLGLTICWRFAEMLGGSVNVESAPGEGASFILRVKADLKEELSREEPSAARPESDLRQVPAIASGQPLALIVDDEPSSVQLLKRIVEQCGYDVVCASNGREGLDLALERKPDLILLDIGMPQLDGWEFLQEMSLDDALRTIPVIVVTVDDAHRRAIVAGASDHLLKPVNRAELNEILGQYASKQSGKVLIVEDDEATSNLYRRGIEQVGYEARVVADGQAAIALLMADEFDLVLTDLHMPGSDGFQVVDSISRMPADKRPRVVVVTGKVLDEEEARQLEGKIAKLVSKNGLSPRKLAFDATNAAFLAPRNTSLPIEQSA